MKNHHRTQKAQSDNATDILSYLFFLLCGLGGFVVSS
jgi:hypothetical protein